MHRTTRRLLPSTMIATAALIAAAALAPAAASAQPDAAKVTTASSKPEPGMQYRGTSADNDGEPEAPLRPTGTPLAPLNPQPEPPGVARPVEGEPAEGTCATCPPPPDPEPGSPAPPPKVYEIEITEVSVCDTEDPSGTDEVYIKINGVKVWGIWGLQHGWAPGYCRDYPLRRREVVRSFTGWANIDIFDADGPDPDDWLGQGTVYTTHNPTKKFTGYFWFDNDVWSYFVDYEVRPVP